jgi:Protein of unknown function (DUF3638)
MITLASAAHWRSPVQEVASDEALCGALQALQAQPTLDVIDEADAYLDCRVQLIYTTGEKQSLPDCGVRCEMMAEALRAFASDERVRQIAETAGILEVEAHAGRWGGMPDLRVVQGARLLCVRFCKLHEQLSMAAGLCSSARGCRLELIVALSCRSAHARVCVTTWHCANQVQWQAV